MDFHRVVPGDPGVNKAPDMCDRVEAALHLAVAGSIVTNHVEPGAKAKAAAIMVH